MSKKISLDLIEQISEALFDRFREDKVLRISKKIVPEILKSGITTIDRNGLLDFLNKVYEEEENSDEIIKMIVDESLKSIRHSDKDEYDDTFFRRIGNLLSTESIELAQDEKNNGMVILSEKDKSKSSLTFFQKNLQKESNEVRKVFPITNWSDLDIKITDTRELIVNYKDVYINKRVDIAEIGMENKKNKKSKQAFEILKLFGTNIKKDDHGFTIFTAKETMKIKRLSDELEEIFGLKKPFENNKAGGYKPKFKIQTNF